MEINITARNFRPSPRLRAHIEDKFSKLARYTTGTSALHLTLISEKTSFRVEAKLGRSVIRHDSEDVMTSIEKCASRLKERLLKEHDRRREHKGRIPLKSAGSVKITGKRTVSPRLRRETQDMLELEEREAAEVLAKSKRDFLVFVSSRTGQMSVMYRRKDGKLGLIEPETVGSTRRG